MLDRGEPDARELLILVLNEKSVRLARGNETVHDYPLDRISFPFETLDDQCFSLHPASQPPQAVCARSKPERNQLITRLTLAFLCRKTNLPGKLPLGAGKVVRGSAEFRGVDITILDGPQGLPSVLLNGKSVQQIQQRQRQQLAVAVHPRPPVPSISQLPNAGVPDEAASACAAPGALAGPALTMEQTAALNESLADRRIIGVHDEKVPQRGYARSQAARAH